jgi:hypothetical protein
MQLIDIVILWCASYGLLISSSDSWPSLSLCLSVCLCLSIFRGGLVRWGPIHRGVPSNADPEPGRCRRTDGKKWRCGRDVVPDQKYCERHMHRGRHRPRRHADGQAGGTGGPPGPGSATSSSGGAAAVSGITNVGPIRSTGSAPTSASSFSLSSLRPSNLSVKSFSSSHSGSPGSGGGSSPAASSQFGQLPNLTSSPSGASNLSNKDYRYSWWVSWHYTHCHAFQLQSLEGKSMEAPGRYAITSTTHKII